MADRSDKGSDSVWYELGYALERAKDAASAPARLTSLAERGLRGKDADDGERRPARSDDDDGTGDLVGSLVATGAGTLAGKLLGVWPRRHRPGVTGYLRAGLAGVGAALVHRMARPLLDGDRPELDAELAEALAAGAARGLLYAAVVEPRLPGGPLLRGAVYGGIEYAVSPWGGMTRLLGRHAPHRKVPYLELLFEGYDPEDDDFLDHVAFAVALAVLYGDAGDDG